MRPDASRWPWLTAAVLGAIAVAWWPGDPGGSVGGGSATSTTGAGSADSRQTALEFLGSGFTRGHGAGTPHNTYFAFRDVATDCLPIYPVTIVWRARPEHKTGYYTTFFWGNDGTFLWKQGRPDSYWGAHPYPDTGIGNFSIHHWEIATGFGGDVTETLGGVPSFVYTGQWLLQGFRAWRDPGGTKVHRFYFELPSLAPTSVIEAKIDASFGNAVPPNPALVWGGAPWGRSFGNDETYRGLIRGIQVYNDVLSEDDMLREARTPLSTVAGRNSIWYLKANPRVNDMTSDVPASTASQCGPRRREPVLRVDQHDVDRDRPGAVESAKVRTWFGSSAD